MGLRLDQSTYGTKWIKTTLPTFSVEMIILDNGAKTGFLVGTYLREWKLSHVRRKEKLKEFHVLRSRCTGRFPPQDLERTGTLKELSLTLYFSLMTDFFFLQDKWNTGDILYPVLSQESDITPHGRLVVEVEKMGISVDGKCRTAKAKDRELCGKEKCQTEALREWNSSRVSLEPVLLVLLMTLAQL